MVKSIWQICGEDQKSGVSGFQSHGRYSSSFCAVLTTSLISVYHLHREIWLWGAGWLVNQDGTGKICLTQLTVSFWVAALLIDLLMPVLCNNSITNSIAVITKCVIINCGAEKTLESPLNSKETKPVHPKGNQPWIFFQRTDAKAETPILWPPDVKNWLIRKDCDAGKDWKWEEKGPTEDETVGWHHRLNGHEFEQAPWVGDGQGSLVRCSPWGRRVGHNWATELNWAEQHSFVSLLHFQVYFQSPLLHQSEYAIPCCNKEPFSESLWLKWTKVYVSFRLYVFHGLAGLFDYQINPGIQDDRAQTLSVVDQGKRTLEGLELTIKCPGLGVMRVTHAHSSSI